VSQLLVMYAINVFVTFSLTLLGMVRHEIRRAERRLDPQARAHARRFHDVHLILVVTVYRSFRRAAGSPSSSPRRW
jgi:hypothetical protein